ncbi:MAG TPA: fumarylacetoacetate hydrolase family protein [Dehalococcoidia bacterium]|nr:fumarylacetoacetate hydrolase family protein [Dehalococcoidia bacterium]
MLFARFRHRDHVAHGILDGGALRPIEGDMFGTYRLRDESVPLAESILLAPLARPGKILAAAVNYRSHVPRSREIIKEEEPPAIPQLFLKPASSIIGPDDAILLPPEARRVDLEGELVAVIGRTCRDVSPEQALDYVFGYTCGNDVSARHWQRDDLQWWRAKGCDTFAPIGPVIAAGLDPTDLRLRTRLNGEAVQDTSTSALIHSVADLISFASAHMTLEPGDLLFTGTPGETPRLSPGDVVEVEIEGIGVLRNPVAAAVGL